MSRNDSTLNWRRRNVIRNREAVKPTEWWAWAPVLDPKASMPPYYRITQPHRRLPERYVELANCKTCGGDVIPICTVTGLEDAKKRAQQDYNDRKKQL